MFEAMITSMDWVWIASLVAKLTALLLFLLGWIATVREMYADESWYGRVGFLFPPIALIYSGMHMNELKRHFWLNLSGYILLAVGIGIEYGVRK